MKLHFYHTIKLRAFAKSNLVRFFPGTKIFVYIFIILTLLPNMSCVSQWSLGEQNAKDKIEKLISAELLLTNNYLNKGEAQKAWDNLRPLYQAHPNHQDVLNMAGLIHLTLENTATAINLFNKVLKIKKSPSASLNLSSAYIAAGRINEAQTIIDDLIKSEESYPYRERFFHNKGLTYEKNGDFKNAIAQYKKALKINPSFILSLNQLANIYKKFGKLATSYKYHSKIIRTCTSCFNSINEIATYLINKQKYQYAIKLLNRYINDKNATSENKKSARRLIAMVHRYAKNKKTSK